MRSLKSSLLAVGVAGFFGFAAVVGCSASGDSGVTDDSNGTNPDNGSASLPPPSSTGGDQPTDAGKTSKPDASHSDAGKDAGPPPPTPGTACTNLNEKKSKMCGKCGSAETVCLDDGSGKTGKWSEYGQCENEVGDCSPGGMQACGNCGTQVCTNYCVWGACTGEPANSCTPGAVDLSTAGCPAADTYRQRSCKASCTWDNYSATCSPPPTYVVVPPTVGSVNSTVFTLKSSQTTTRLTGSCPNGSLSTTATPYAFNEVRNTTSKTVKVSIYHTQATGGGVIDTVIAAYDGATPPGSDAARKACVKGVNDFGSSALVGNTDFASLDDTGFTKNAVTIAPGASVTVYSATYPAYDAANPADTTGKVMLNVRLESIQ